MSQWIDVSVPIHPRMPVYEGDPAVKVELVQRIASGDSANVSRLDLGAHTGTHVDAPFHFIDGGRTVDALPFNALIGPALVVHLPEAERIEAAHLPDLHGHRRVLFRTRNSKAWREPGFRRDFVALGFSAAQQMVQTGVGLVGIDYLSIEGFRSRGHPVHKLLLSAGIVIVEGLDLSTVEAGQYELVCLPLRILGGDGAPARAILRPLKGGDLGPRS